MTHAPSHRRPRRLGLSLAETLIALSISAALLTAVGSGLIAASSAATTVDQFYRSQQSARQSINRIASEVRKCQSIVVSANQLVITTDTSQTNTYTFDRINRRLTLSVPQPVPNPPLVTVLAFDVDSTSAFSTDGRAVAMTISITVGRNAATLTGSAMPRRSMQYR